MRISPDWTGWSKASHGGKEGLTQGVRMQKDHHRMQCDTVKIGEASRLAGD